MAALETSPAPFRYRRLGYVAFNVTDLKRSLAFYRDLVGLQLVAADEQEVHLRCSEGHHDLVLYRAPVAGLKRAAFQLESERELDRAFAHFERIGQQPAWLAASDARALNLARAFRVRERHSGLLIEYFAAMTRMAEPFQPTVARIARLGHVVIASRDYAQTRRALLEDFNFRVSDYVEDRIAFLRGFPNPLHHTFAVSADDHSHFHHLNFMVTDIDDVGRALHRMSRAGVKIVFGPGRHPPSGSIFLYFLDPDGLTVEYSFGMEEFPESDPREPRMLEPVPRSMDTWGAVPDAQFATGGAIEGAA